MKVLQQGRNEVRAEGLGDDSTTRVSPCCLQSLVVELGSWLLRREVDLRPRVPEFSVWAAKENGFQARPREGWKRNIPPEL